MARRKNPERIAFDFVRSPFFRVVHSNGAWGGITPQGELSVTFYSERSAPPRRITHELTSEGLGREVSRDGGSNVQREYEVEVLMNMREAISLHQWLGRHIDTWQTLSTGIQETPQEAP